MLWPGTVLVTGKPRHSESNGGIERRNRTVEEKISNWMHENKSKHWAQSLPFIQWRCNTQIHRGIGNRTPYHLMFGQHPQVGISNLPIAPHMLASLATEMDVNRCLGLDADVPLEEATLPMCSRKSDTPSSTVANTTTTQVNPLETARDRTTNTNQSETALAKTTHHNEFDRSGKASAYEDDQLARRAFTRQGYNVDRTDELVAQLLKKITVNTAKRSYFGWKGLGFQVGAVFLSLPSHVNLNMRSGLTMTGGFPISKPKKGNLLLTDGSTFGNLKSPPEEVGNLKSPQGPPEEMDDSMPQKNTGAVQLLPPSDQIFLPTILDNQSNYVGDVRHPWISLLLQMSQPTNAVTLENSNIRSCFAVMDKESKMTDPWRRVILRRVRKQMWEILDEYGDTVLEICLHRGVKGVVEKWGEWFRSPTVKDFNAALLADKKRKEECSVREKELMESPRRKSLRNAAFQSLSLQGRQMKRKALSDHQLSFAVGSIVQVPLHDVDTTKADGKNLTLVVVEVVQPKDKSCAKYRLACKAGVLDTLYHPSYMTSVASNIKVLGLESVLDEWTGLPRIKERRAAASVSMVGGQGKHLECRCMGGTCHTGRWTCFNAELKCNSKCHGGGNKNCTNKD